MMSQSHQQHMVMPAHPTAHFVVVETDLAFGFFKNGFDGPTHAADTHKLNQGGLFWGIAEVKLDLAGVIQVAAYDQPEFRARQIGPSFDDPYEDKVAHDGTLRAFFDGNRAPTFFRDQRHQSANAERTIEWVPQAQASGMTNTAFPLGDIHLRPGKPDQGCAFDFRQVPFFQFSHPFNPFQ